MVHEVYICYDETDKPTADAVCHVLEENKIKCWIKPRDLGVGHPVEECMDAILNSDVFVLIFSESSNDSNFVKTEVNMAFENNLPMVVFSIDDSELDEGLKFFLQGKHWLDAHPNPEIEFRRLIEDTAKLLGKEINDVTLKDNMKVEPKPQNNKVPITPPKKNRTLIISAIAIIAVAAIVLFAFGGVGDMAGDNPIESIDITDVVVEDHTGERSTFNFTYRIKGIINYHTNNTDDYQILSELYDSNGALQDSYEMDLSKATSGEVSNLGGGITGQDNITKVAVKVIDVKTNQTMKQADHQA